MPSSNTTSPQPSYELLQQVFDALHEVVCVLDTHGRYIYINNACLPIWGYEPAELLGRPCFEIIVPEDHEFSIRATVAAGSRIPTFENRYIRKDGSIAYMSWEGVWDTTHQLIYGTGRDITEAKRLDTLEQQHRLEFQELLERITDGFCGLDQDSRVTYWNKAAESISGLSQEQMIGQALLDVLPEPSRSLVMQKLPAIKELNKPFHYEYYTNRIHRWIEVNVYFSGTGVSIFFRDVTERHQLQEQLLEEKEKRHQEHQQQQKRITAAVIKATEEERAFVGKELHDNVNQVLTTVKLYNELCITNHNSREELLKRSAQLLQESINEIRGLSKRLSAPSLGGIHLRDSIKELIDAINVTNRLQIDYEDNIDGLTTPEATHIAVYRILQEHFTNILKHARATKASVRMLLEGETLHISVHDNGQGFDPSAHSKGVGLENMISRAESINAALQLDSAPAKGCTLQLVVPLI